MSNPVSRGMPCVGPPEARDHVSQVAVVHVERPAPRDPVRVDAALVAVEDVPVDERREHVVRGRDGVEVAREVEVQVLHRHDLGEPAARGAALDAEDRAERRLAQAQHRPLADVPEPLGERHRGRRLALAGLGRRDRRDAHDLGVRCARQAVDRPRLTFALYFPYRSTSSSSRPISRAMSRIGRRVASWAISRLDFTGAPSGVSGRRRRRRARRRARSRRSGRAGTARSVRASGRWRPARPSSCRRSARP